MKRREFLAAGGAVWFESSPERGTTFHVELPVASRALPG